MKIRHFELFIWLTSLSKITQGVLFKFVSGSPADFFESIQKIVSKTDSFC